MTHDNFKTDLTACDADEKRRAFMQKHIMHGLPFVFAGREDEYFEFRTRIAQHFGINYQNVFIVGSAKLGFNYFSGKAFSYESDIDVVLVDERLFERYYENICDYQYQLDKNYRAIDSRELNLYRSFLQYLVKGWMRPDKLPLSFEISILKDEWFGFFQSISFGKSEVGNYKINAGLFKNTAYLEKYYLNGVTEFYNQLKIPSNG